MCFAPFAVEELGWAETAKTDDGLCVCICSLFFSEESKPGAINKAPLSYHRGLGWGAIDRSVRDGQ